MNMIVRRDPWSLLDQWHKELDNMFDPNRRGDDTSRIEGSDWTPAVDIKEEADRYLLHADIPGVKADDIEVSMDKGVLTIKGERKHESTESKEGYKRVERTHGVFMRRFSLPDGVDGENISASSKDGVLEVVIPKSEPEKPRRIEVK
ncbi:MAG: Hsp20/alpha crystallin family protein [Gammaproteobacteria bacterium]|jgi:HSP20 family protein